MSNSLNSLYPIAESRGGYFTTAQAHAVAVSDQQLHYLTKSGSLERAAHGVYRLTRFPARPFEDVIVACLWAGGGTTASHDTALAIYGLTDAMPATIHITVPRRFRGKRKGVIVHVAPLEAHESTTREGVPITTPGRMIRDLWARYGVDHAADAAGQALIHGIISQRQLVRELASDDDSPLLERLGLTS